MASDTWRVTGFEDDLTVTQLVAPLQTTNVTPVVKPSASTGFDTTGWGRGRFLIILTVARVAQGVTFTVTESATTNGTYTAATTSGTLTKMTASGVEYVSVKRNLAKPFIRITATGDNASTDVTWSAVLVAM